MFILNVIDYIKEKSEMKRTLKWWQKAVIYQIYLRSFRDSDGDGVGDLNGVIEKIDYLKELGIDAIWLSPYNRSPNADNGYDVSDYYAVSPEYGTLEDFRRLKDKAHSLGIRLIMDLVVNHTSDEHPWFVESRKSKNSPYRDYYFWRKGKADGQPPSDALNMFGGSAWEYDAATDEYCYHLFTKKQYDLNWENPAVPEEVVKICRFWIEKGIDGFRIDCANLFGKDTSFPSVGNGPDALEKRDALIFNNPKNHRYFHMLNERVLKPYDVPAFGECSKIDIEEASLYSDPAREELSGIIQFEHVKIDDGPNGEKWVDIPCDPRKLKASLSKWQKGLENKGWNCLYLDNHDQPRLISRFGDDKKYRETCGKMFATLLMTLQGTPFVYQGSEIGMTNLNLTYDEIDDCEVKMVIEENNRTHALSPEALLRAINKRGRDNSRTPMQWSAEKNAGFTSAERPWFKLNPNYKQINVEESLARENSLLYYYRKAIALRKSEEVFTEGSFRELLADHPAAFVYERQCENARALILLNFTAQPQQLSSDVFEEYKNAALLLKNYPDSPSVEKNIPLRPFEALVFKINN